MSRLGKILESFEHLNESVNKADLVLLAIKDSGREEALYFWDKRQNCYVIQRNGAGSRLSGPYNVASDSMIPDDVKRKKAEKIK